jgi:integrase
MDLTYLRDNYKKLLDFMTDNSYNCRYIRDIELEIQNILSINEYKNFTSYEHIFTEYTNELFSRNYLNYKHTILNVIKNFDVEKRFPDGQRPSIEGKYSNLSDEFKSVIDYFRADALKRNLKNSSIKIISSNSASFLSDLQQKGIDTLDKIDEKSVLSLFCASETNVNRGYGCEKCIMAVFKACKPLNNNLYTKILSYFPLLRNKRKNIQYLTPEEITSFKQMLQSNTEITLRDKAIGTLALYTGLRISDITGLTLSSIDFENDLIILNQQKTGNPIDIAMTSIVGNAIYDYISQERPQSEFNYLFLSYNRPFSRLTSTGASNIANILMKKANIRQNKGDRRGFHIFRHHFVSELLANEVPIPLISKALGHISPKSLGPYLYSDFEHLKGCALSISKFPVAKWVFQS